MTVLKTVFFAVFIHLKQGAKRVMSDSADGLDFALGLVNFVVNLHDGQVNFFEDFKLENNYYNQSCSW